MVKAQEVELAKVDAKIAYHTLMTHYWIGMATSGGTIQRDLHHGFGKRYPLTDKEKLKDAMDAAHRHIELVSEFNKSRVSIIEGVS